MNGEERDDFERRVANELATEAGLCPDESELLAFERGELEGKGAEEMVRHTERCGRCQSLLLEERRMVRLMSKVAGMSESELPDVDEKLRRRIFSAIGREGGATVTWWARRVAVPVWAALAAAAALVLLAYPAWHGLVRPRAPRPASPGLDRPVSDVQVLTLFGGVRSSASLPEADASRRLVVLQLGMLADLRGCHHFRAELKNESGSLVWSSDAVKPADSFGGFILAIPGSMLQPGAATVTVLGFSDGAEKLREQYEFAVTR